MCMFAVPAGGRSFRTHELLVKQKRMAGHSSCLACCAPAASPKRTPLAENSCRELLRPLDQFRAFQSSAKRA